MTNEITTDSSRMRMPKSHISLRSGASSSSTSTVSARLVVDGPSTRTTRLPWPSKVPNEPLMASRMSG